MFVVLKLKKYDRVMRLNLFCEFRRPHCRRSLEYYNSCPVSLELFHFMDIFNETAPQVL